GQLLQAVEGMAAGVALEGVDGHGAHEKWGKPQAIWWHVSRIQARRAARDAGSGGWPGRFRRAAVEVASRGRHACDASPAPARLASPPRLDRATDHAAAHAVDGSQAIVGGRSPTDPSRNPINGVLEPSRALRMPARRYGDPIRGLDGRNDGRKPSLPPAGA